MATTNRCWINGLMVAGLIVTVIGLAVVLARSLQIPRDWTPGYVGNIMSECRLEALLH